MQISVPRTRMNNDDVDTYGYYYKFSYVWMDFAKRLALESPATRKKVGCVIVTKSGGLYTGYNGTISGDSNTCELDDVTLPELYHAEENALDKMALDRVIPEGAIVYLTLSPCLSCAKRLRAMKVGAVFYDELYRCQEGVKFLQKNSITCNMLKSMDFSCPDTAL